VKLVVEFYFASKTFRLFMKFTIKISKLVLPVPSRGGHSRGYSIVLLIDFLYGTVGRN
jgi:hypothetical protein